MRQELISFPSIKAVGSKISVNSKIAARRHKIEPLAQVITTLLKPIYRQTANIQSARYKIALHANLMVFQAEARSQTEKIHQDLETINFRANLGITFRRKHWESRVACRQSEKILKDMIKRMWLWQNFEQIKKK